VVSDVLETLSNKVAIVSDPLLRPHAGVAQFAPKPKLLTRILSAPTPGNALSLATLAIMHAATSVSQTIRPAVKSSVHLLKTALLSAKTAYALMNARLTWATRFSPMLTRQLIDASIWHQIQTTAVHSAMCVLPDITAKASLSVSVAPALSTALDTHTSTCLIAHLTAPINRSRSKSVVLKRDFLRR